MNPNEKPPVTPTLPTQPLEPAPPLLAPATDLDLMALLSFPSPAPGSSALSPSPAPPAYSALPYRDADFDFAPILHGKVGDVELETTDGKRFLVHRKVLEAETVFFHIYYGFVPAWRLNASAAACANLPPNPHFPNPPHIPSERPGRTPAVRGNGNGNSQSNALGLVNLLSIPRMLAASLTSSPPAEHAAALPLLPAPVLGSSDDNMPMSPPPPAPPKEVTAPTPTTSPYTWSVPEHSSVLLAFLSLIYPLGFLTPSRTTLLTSPEMTTKVIRAALGYQSSKALGLARDRLAHWVQERPVDIYAMAAFFKFSDLATLASQHALRVPREEWSAEAIKMMGRSGAGRLLQLQADRLAGLRGILSQVRLEQDAHSAMCGYTASIRQLWQNRCESLGAEVQPHSDLMQLFDTDLATVPLVDLDGRAQPCAQCVVLFGRTARQCVSLAKDLRQNIA